MASSKLKLTYFNARGRAELARIVLAAGGKDYEDSRFGEGDWPKVKADTLFEQVPILEVDGKVYGQSMAIATFLAREFGFYGKTNLDGLAIDQYMQLIQDLVSVAVKGFMEKDETKKAEIWKNFKETDCTKLFGYFEKGLKDNGTGYLVGDKLSLADLAIFDLITGFLEKQLASTDSYPQLKALVAKVGSMDKIKKWIETRPVT